MPYQTFVVAGHENDEFSFQKLELPSQARTFWAMGPGPLGAVANGFRLIQQAGTTKVWFFFFCCFLCWYYGGSICLESDRTATTSILRYLCSVVTSNHFPRLAYP